MLQYLQPCLFCHRNFFQNPSRCLQRKLSLSTCTFHKETEKFMWVFDNVNTHFYCKACITRTLVIYGNCCIDWVTTGLSEPKYMLHSEHCRKARYNVYYCCDIIHYCDFTHSYLPHSSILCQMSLKTKPAMENCQLPILWHQCGFIYLNWIHN